MTTPLGFVDKWANKIENRVNQLVLRAFMRLGEQCVARIRERPQESSWYDQTGNLRSSIGYGVVHNGELVEQSYFDTIAGGQEGSNAGNDYLESCVDDVRDAEWALIVVAGMEYATYVEDMDGKDVLASTELWAQTQSEKIVERLAKQIDKIK